MIKTSAFFLSLVSRFVTHFSSVYESDKRVK